MSFNPQNIINVAEHGNSFALIDDSITWLINQAKTKGYDAHIMASWLIEGTTRFANSQVTQHTDLNNISFTLKLSKDKQFAASSSSFLSEKGLSNLFDEVELGVKSTPPIDFYQGLPTVNIGSLVNSIGKEWSMEDRADAIITAANAAEEIDSKVITAGVATETREYLRITTTEGHDVEDATHRSYFKVNAICGQPDQRGYGQEEGYWRYDQPNYTQMAQEATRTATNTIDLVTLDAPKDYEVLLGQQAAYDLLTYILFSVDATSFHESNSFASDRLGEQIFDDKLTIENTPRDPKRITMSASYDFEGIPTSNQMFIDHGVLKFIPYNSFYAAKYLGDKNSATGNSFRLPWGVTTTPLAGAVSLGEKTLQQQIADMQDGLYVKNFWYIRYTIRREGGLTGLTRNGLFHVKDGEIQGAVRNLRFTESFLRALGQDNIRSIGKESTMFLSATVPSIHLDKYHFSSVAHTAD